MTAQQQGSVRMTVVARGTIATKRAIAWDGTQAGAGVAIMGIADHAAVTGDAVRVIVGPTAIAEAGAAIDGTTTTLKTDSGGRMIVTTSGGDVVAARLMPGQTATAAGDLIEVFPVTQQ